MRKDGRTWSEDEPARQKSYRKLYLRYKNDMNRFEDVLTFIQKQLKELRERVEKLEFKDHHL